MLLFTFPPTECSSRTHSKKRKRRGVERQTFVGAPLREEREACLRERARNQKLIWNTNKATLEKRPTNPISSVLIRGSVRRGPWPAAQTTRHRPQTTRHRPLINLGPVGSDPATRVPTHQSPNPRPGSRVGSWYILILLIFMVTT